MRDNRWSGDAAPLAVWFAYSPDRKGIHPQTHLANFKGVLQADAYTGFNVLNEGGAIQESAYWAYARRKFYDLREGQPSEPTTDALRRISVYVIEAGTNHPINDDRCAKQKHSH